MSILKDKNAGTPCSSKIFARSVPFRYTSLLTIIKRPQSLGCFTTNTYRTFVGAIIGMFVRRNDEIANNNVWNISYCPKR